MAALAPTEIKGKFFGTPENSNSTRTGMKHWIEYNNKSIGTFRMLQALDRVSKYVTMVFKEMGHHLATFFEDLGKKLSLAWAMLAIPRLPAVTYTALYGNDSSSASGFRKHAEKLRDVTDCASLWGYAASILFGNNQIKNAADATCFVADMTDATLAAQDLGEIQTHLNELEQVAPGKKSDLKTRFENTRTDALLRLAKSVASVVSGALGLLVLAFGGPVLPAIVLLTISTFSTVMALTAHFYKETRTFELVKLHEVPQLINGQKVY